MIYESDLRHHLTVYLYILDRQSFVLFLPFLLHPSRRKLIKVFLPRIVATSTFTQNFLFSFSFSLPENVPLEQSGSVSLVAN